MDNEIQGFNNVHQIDVNELTIQQTAANNMLILQSSVYTELQNSFIIIETVLKCDRNILMITWI